MHITMYCHAVSVVVPCRSGQNSMIYKISILVICSDHERLLDIVTPRYLAYHYSSLFDNMIRDSEMGKGVMVNVAVATH